MINKPIRTIHFIAICGTAMANLAVKMKQMGYSITGSDENFYPPMSTFLEQNNVHLFSNFDEKNVDYKPDLVIIGNAVVRGNPEAEYVLDNKLLYMSLPEALKEFFLRDKNNIVVTGTHGKTTSSALLAWVLEKSKLNPNFLIGGIPENFGFGFQFGQGENFILEGDEYDSAFFDKRSKFLHYLPKIVILNNIEFDHADIFRSLDDIKICFNHLIKLIPRSGLLVANGDDPVVCELIKDSFSPVETFGFGKNVKWQIFSVKHLKTGVEFIVNQNGRKFGQFFLPLSGNHNILNATGVLIVLNHLGLKNQKIQEGFDTFKSIRRRLEIRGVIKDITIYDDFAHHPTAIRETITGLHLQDPKKRIWAIFEPRTNTTRRNILQQNFADSFKHAYGIALGKINRPHLLEAEERLDRDKICKKLISQKKQAFYADDVDELISWLLPKLQSGDKVVIMSNGSFDDLHNKLIKRLETS